MADYSIWLLEFCNIPAHPARAIYTGYYAEGESFYFPESVTLLKGDRKNILVDCGVNWSNPAMAAFAEQYSIVNRRNTDDMLREIGVAPEDIDAIILTHAHFDHMGALSLFPNAQVYLQRDELFLWLEAMAKPGTYSLMREAVHISNFHEVLDVLAQGRLTLLDGPVDNLFPGIHIQVERLGHSFASQLVVIENDIDGKKDEYIVVGDVVYSTHNLTGAGDIKSFIPNTSYAAGSVYYTLQTYEKICNLVKGDMNKVIIGHDRESWERHPSITLKSGMHLAEVYLAPGEPTKLS